MKRQNIIVIIGEDKIPKTRGNFKKACIEFGFPYHSLKMKSFPIIWENYEIHKCPFL